MLTLSPGVFARVGMEGQKRGSKSSVTCLRSTVLEYAVPSSSHGHPPSSSQTVSVSRHATAIHWTIHTRICIFWRQTLTRWLSIITLLSKSNLPGDPALLRLYVRICRIKAICSASLGSWKGHQPFVAHSTRHPRHHPVKYDHRYT